MSDKTMLDLGGLAFLEGDPLGLRDLEEALVWRANGPLPDWLDGAEPLDDEFVAEDAESVDVESLHDEPVDLPPSAPADKYATCPDIDVVPQGVAEAESILSGEPRPATPATVVIVAPSEPGPVAPPLIELLDDLQKLSHEVTTAVQAPLTAELIEPAAATPADAVPTETPPIDVIDTPPTAAPSGEPVAEGLVSINDLFRFVDEDPLPAPVAPESAAPPAAPPPKSAIPTMPAIPARRFLSFDELIDARLCLLTAVADQLWAIPLDRVAVVAAPANGTAIDLFERQEGKKRRGVGVAIAFDSDATVIVDRVLGPRSIGWDQLSPNSDAPHWMLAQSTIAGQHVGLLDWETLTN